MSKVGAKPVKTFSIGFDEKDFSEVTYARQVARLYETEHHEEVLRPHAAELLPKLVRAYGEPFADPSALPTYLLSEMTRRHVTVALSGDGGDEALAGYTRYAHEKMTRLFQRLPRPLLLPVARFIERRFPGTQGRLPRRAGRHRAHARPPRADGRHPALRGAVRPLHRPSRWRSSARPICRRRGRTRAGRCSAACCRRRPRPTRSGACSSSTRRPIWSTTSSRRSTSRRCRTRWRSAARSSITC